MIKKLLAVVVLIALIGAAGVFYVVSQAKQYVNKPILLEQPQLFTVENGTSFNQIIRNLVKQKLSSLLNILVYSASLSGTVTS